MNSSNKKVAVILPVRKGSQRVPNKNFRKFADSSLFEIKLKTLSKLNFIDELIVSTDCDRAAMLARKYGASVHMREDYYASSLCTNSEFFLNFSKMTKADYIMYSPCTSPLLTSKTYYSFINGFYRMGEEYDSMATVKIIKQHLWDDKSPLNYDLSKSPNSQDLPNIYSLTYGINMISRNKLIEYKNIVGKSPNFYILNNIEAIDIDDMDEFDAAEFFYKKMNNV